MKIKRLLAWVTLLALVICQMPALPVQAQTEEVNNDDVIELPMVPIVGKQEVASGTCGENLTWVLDNAGTLTISGTGDMAHYNPWADYAPWYSHRDAVRKIIINSGVTSVGWYAFYGYSNLAEVIIPDSVTQIAAYAFSRCESLIGIYVDENNADYASDDRGVLFNKAMSSLIQAPGGLSGSYVIPDGVTYIGESVFSGCSSLTGITIHDRVIELGPGAFADCSSLTSVNIGSGVTAIGSYAFDNCGSLEKVNYTGTEEEWNAIIILDDGNDSLLNAQIVYNGAVEEGPSVVASGECGENLTWVLDGEGTLTISGTGAMENYYWGSEIPWYQYSGLIKLVVLEDGVTSIGDCAFDSCENMTTVALGRDVSGIGESAFRRCPNFTTFIVSADNRYFASDSSGILMNKDMTEIVAVPGGITGAVIIPEGVTTIGEDAFFECIELTGVTIPDSVTTIGDWAFRNCYKLTDVIFGNGVKTIGGDAFYSCSELKNVTLPNGLESIGESAFYDCDAMTEVVIPDSVTNIGNYAFSNCSGLTTVTIGNGVKSIDDSAFYYCTELETVVMGNSVTQIGRNAFNSCTKLLDITIPDSIISIGDFAFEYCHQLAYTTYENACYLGNPNNPYLVLVMAAAYDITSCTIHEDTKIICSEAFYACSSLKKIAIPNGVTQIGGYAFSGCVAMEEITIGSGVKTIGNSAFQGCHGLTQVVIPEGVTSIGNYVFRYCSGLEKVSIPNSLTEVGDNLFPDSENLQYNVYGNCNYLGNEDNPYLLLMGAVSANITSCTIHKDTKIICSYAFDDCSVLADIYIEDMSTWFGIEMGANPLAANGKQKNLYVGGELLTELVIPAGTTSIAPSAFYNCSSLTSVVIPNTVTSIGWNAFAGCSGLTSVSIPDSVTEMGEYAFAHCENLTDITIGSGVTEIAYKAFSNCSSLKTLEIPDSVTSIYKSAFEYCDSLETVTIGSGVAKIGAGVFYDCGSLAGIWVDENNAYYTSDARGALLNKAKTELIKVPTTVSGHYIVAEGVQTIDHSAFYGSAGLTKVTLPASLTYIDAESFKYCTGLTKLVIPEGVTYINAWALQGCSNLKTLTLPRSLTYISIEVFSGCNSLETVNYTGTQEEWSNVSIADWGNEELLNATMVYEYVVPEAISGTCGENLTWVLDDEGTLTISGTGDMTNYAWTSNGSTYSTHPWKDVAASVKTIVIEDGVTSIGSYAFAYFGSLTEVIIPEGVTSIGDFAFYFCRSLPSITIPASVTYINWSSLCGCDMLTGICVDEDNANYTNDERGVLFNKEMTTVVLAPDGMTGIYVIPEGVTTIGEDAFASCDITEITIPVSVKLIEWSAFSACDLDKVIYCGNMEQWNQITIEGGNGDLYDAMRVYLISGTCGENLTWTLDGEGVLTISGTGDMDDYECYGNDLEITILNHPWENLSASIKKIVIEDGVTSIGDVAFPNCSNLTSVTIPDSVISIGMLAFYNCSGLTSITIPDSVTSIGDGVFAYCTNLTSITIPDSVTSIGDAAFGGCTSLANITIPDGVTRIGASAFGGCTSLASITIPESVISIGYAAFSGCSSLEKVYYGGNEKGWNGIEIEDLNDELLNAAIEYLGPDAEPGDMNGDEAITDADALYLLRYTLFPSRYPVELDPDVNNDGTVTDADALYLLRYTLFPNRYPLYPKK